MKHKLIIAAVTALSLSHVSFADTVAYVRNESGGKIVLTDESCEAKQDMLRTYKYTGADEGHLTWEGCWKDDDITVLVNWVEENQIQRYEKRKFKFVNGRRK